MNRYRFRLEALLRVRRLEEQAARAALVRANSTVAAATASADQAVARYRAEASTVPTASEGGRLTTDRAGAMAKAETAADAQRRLAAALVTAEAARSGWSAAAAAVEGLERLDDRARTTWLAEARRAEDAEVDDLVVGHHGRTR